MHIPRISLVALRLSLTTGQVEGNIDIMMSLRQNKDLSYDSMLHSAIDGKFTNGCIEYL